MTTIILTKSNLLEMLPKILEKIREGFKAEIKLVNDSQVQQEEDFDINYVISWEWMTEEDKKVFEEFEKLRKQIPYEKKIKDLKKNRKLFKEILWDLYIK